MAQLKLPANKFIIVETEQIEKFVKELNDIKEGWEFRLLELETRVKKLEGQGKVKVKRARNYSK